MEVVDLVVRSLVNMVVWREWLWELFLAFWGGRISTVRGKIRGIINKGIRDTINRDTIPIREVSPVDGILVNPLNNNNSNSNKDKDNSVPLPGIRLRGILTQETIPNSNNSNNMEPPISPQIT